MRGCKQGPESLRAMCQERYTLASKEGCSRQKRSLILTYVRHFCSLCLGSSYGEETVFSFRGKVWLSEDPLIVFRNFRKDIKNGGT
ncbi:hypothetical protein CDAR_216991 [Caerostris darwini]|uniref:Uncharacterized protein n=1 Tax=Caerostris darwini TaxID=1538125 RepID=A0AAV4UU75_9ARAC|nr:hypothetical protein CDAR_216991 [Caerostris darwini]